jgi:uncharacterized membrane protein YkvA (DUF1232 family)
VALKSRLEAEFAEAVSTAKFYVEDPQRLLMLFADASKEAVTVPRGALGDTWPYLQTMLRLIRAYSRGNYRSIEINAMVVIVAAVIYFVSPLDVIPDAIPQLGYLDDATILAIALRRTRHELDDFMIWETAAG